MAKVLIVDDHATNREFLATLLAYKGHEICEARDGADALDKALAKRPDLIITDVLMPTMDGYEFVRRLRLEPRIANTAVIFCTANYLEHDAQRLARSCGVTHLLSKPCEPEVVIRTVDAALGIAAETIAPMAPPQFDRDHLALLTNKLSQKTTELEIANQRLGVLIDISLQLATESDAARLLDSVCRSARELIGASYAFVAATENDSTRPQHFVTSGASDRIVHAIGMPSLHEGILGAVLAARRAERRDGEIDPRELPGGFPALRSLLAAPISSQHNVYGWLCLGDKIGGERFSDDDERLVVILGAQIGRLYENITLYTRSQRYAADLEHEAAERRDAQERLRAQLARLDLLHRITRAIGERQDLYSIYQVVVRSLEGDMPIDFGCICLYEPADKVLTVACVGVRNGSLAMELAMTDQARIPIDANGLSRCVRGELVYEASLDRVPFAFPQRLARAGLRALVAAPLLAENRVFGVLLAARRQSESFSSQDVEFLGRLSEHVALAAHQVHLYGTLQTAYEDLRETQQVVMQQDRLKALGQMASGVAHDINNAISPVALYTETLLEQEPNLSERARTNLGTIRRAIDDVAHTVSRMREFYRPLGSQASAGQIDLRLLVGQVVEFTRARWKDQPQQRGVVVELRVQTEPGLPVIAGIEGELRDALTNLVFNAVDAMPQGGTITIRAYTKAVSKGTFVFLEVSDTGNGMDEMTRRRCLEPFFTTKGERGTGLGLAMVYGMAQRHGAEMSIDSVLGAGTTIRLVFPTARAGQEVAGDSEMIKPSQPLSILIVDDDPMIIASLREALEGDGHRVVAADGGQAGIDAFVAAHRAHQSFAVVITDLGMPYVDGRKVSATLKKESPGTPIIMLTGWGQHLASDDELPPNVDRVLSKPPKLAELRRALAELTRAADARA